MTRRKSREQAFIILFEKTFSEDTIAEILEKAGESREIVSDDFALSLAQGTTDHLEEIDTLISQFSLKWSKDRLSRVALTLLRMAVFEMQWCDDIPVSVTINEAVELAKLYGGDADASYVNGVLGGIDRRDVKTHEE